MTENLPMVISPKIAFISPYGSIENVLAIKSQFCTALLVGAVFTEDPDLEEKLTAELFRHLEEIKIESIFGLEEPTKETSFNENEFLDLVSKHRVSNVERPGYNPYTEGLRSRNPTLNLIPIKKE